MTLILIYSAMLEISFVFVYVVRGRQKIEHVLSQVKIGIERVAKQGEMDRGMDVHEYSHHQAQ